MGPSGTVGPSGSHGMERDRGGPHPLWAGRGKTKRVDRRECCSARPRNGRRELGDRPLAGERPRKLPSRASGRPPPSEAPRCACGCLRACVGGYARALECVCVCVCVCRCSLRVDAQRGELPGECGDIRLQKRVRVDRVHRNAQRIAATDSAPHATDNVQAAHNRMPK